MTHAHAHGTQDANDDISSSHTAELNALFGRFETITLDVNDIDGELSRFTGEYSRVGYNLAVATRTLALAKLKLDRTEARLMLEVKHTSEVKNAKMSLPVMSATVKQLDQYTRVHLEFIAATFERDRLRADLNTLETKGRHVDVLGRRQTAEFNATKFNNDT